MNIKIPMQDQDGKDRFLLVKAHALRVGERVLLSREQVHRIHDVTGRTPDRGHVFYDTKGRAYRFVDEEFGLKHTFYLERAL